MRAFYIIAKNDLEPDFPHSSSWPKVIGYSFTDKYFYLSEGKGHGFAANDMPESKAKRPECLETFSTLNALWFLDLINNTTFTTEEEFADRVTAIIGSVDKINF
ncbi:hypothetical protein ACOI9X_13045 [Pseudomonas sp. P2757]|uniref:hypothetical protein n=1 Tax=Pseudomonas sp. P2757 TaxID=3409917 RepID=UPI003B5912A1